jgi:hypothetical protein
VDAEAGAHSGVEAVDDLGRDGVEAVVVGAHAPELLGDVEAEEPLGAGLLPDVTVDRLDLEHLLGARLERALDELAHGGAEVLVLGTVDVAGHGTPPVLGSAWSRRD